MYKRTQFVREVCMYYFENFPKLTNKQIHELTGTRASYVSTLRKELGYQAEIDARFKDVVLLSTSRIPKPKEIISNLYC